MLEDLFNKKGIGDVHWRTIFSRAADEILREKILASTVQFIVDYESRNTGKKRPRPGFQDNEEAQENEEYV